MTTSFENLNAGDSIDGPKFAVSRESIRLFCDASLDYNPLHLDDDFMKGNFGKTNFGGIIMHGMNNFGLISRMLTDWAYPLGARAMYLGETEFRIHGTNKPDTIGKRVSSGCIRLTNDDVVDLYERVKVGAKVIVLPPAAASPSNRSSATNAQMLSSGPRIAEAR